MPAYAGTETYPDRRRRAAHRDDARGFPRGALDVNLRGGETCWPVADALAAAGIPFILATGGAGDSIAEAHRSRPVLSKPFTIDGVEKALDGLG
jgi:hypothetical protein